MRAICGVVLGLALAGCGADGGSSPNAGAVAPGGPDGGRAPDDGGAGGDATTSPDGAAPGTSPPLGGTVTATGATFRVWAPHAERAFVAGDFNGGSETANELLPAGGGVFAGDVPGAHAGQSYAFVFSYAGQTLHRADPRARHVLGSKGASVLVDPGAYPWNAPSFQPAPIEKQVIYELHIGSFNAPVPKQPGTWATAIAKLDDLARLGVNMLEVMPPAEFTGDYSWGYNPAFPFAPETAYGTPDDMRLFVDEAHARNMGVIVDVVHNHWGPEDLPMRCYDGDCLGAQGIYFYGDSRATTPWGPRPDFSRPEVRAYIEDSALAWLTELRCDGLRWDSVSNIRQAGGIDNPDGRALLVHAMDAIHALPHKLMIAEDLQTLDVVTQSTAQNGLGFDTQWDAAFFHPVDDTCTAGTDTARSMASLAGAIRHAYNGQHLQRVVYSEDHDEVANGRARIPEMISPGNAGSLLARKISTLGAVTVMTSPGIPMLFMGQEFLQNGHFADDAPLDWSRAQTYAGILALYTDLVALRKNTAGATAGLSSEHTDVMHVNDVDKVIGWRRWGKGGPGDDVIVLANWSAKAFTAYDIGVPSAGTWHVRFDSDDKKYGADYGGASSADVVARAGAKDGYLYAITLPLAAYSAFVVSQ